MRKEAELRSGNHDQKHRLLATHHRASWEARRRYDVILVAALQQFPAGRLRMVGLWWKKPTNWCAICGEKYDWKQPNCLLVVQTGESINQDSFWSACSTTGPLWKSDLMR